MTSKSCLPTPSQSSEAIGPDDQLAVLTRIFSRQSELGVCSAETYIPALRPRELPLWKSDSELADLLRELARRRTSQLHCSYFGNPSCLFAGPGTQAYFALQQNLGGTSGMKSYYGDLTGEHVIERVCDEYELAVHAGIDHYSAHFGIDYSFSDGMYDYSKEYGLDRSRVLHACIAQTEVYLRRIHERLLSKNLLEDPYTLPTIGIENAGWGLEYGMQTRSDFKSLFNYLEDRKVPLRELVMIDWDLNHLLHALGCETSSGRARFFLPADEITDLMHNLVVETNGDPATLAVQWLFDNVLSLELLPRVRCVHLSDCAWKSESYFARCQAVGEHLRTLEEEESPERRALLGEQMVLKHYDNHLYLGSSNGMLEQSCFAPFAQSLQKEKVKRNTTYGREKSLIILHELKNYTFTGFGNKSSQEIALERQVQFLGNCGVFIGDARLEVRI